MGAPGGPLPWLGWLAPLGLVATRRPAPLRFRLVGAAAIAGSSTAPIVAALAFRAPWHGVVLSLGPSAWLAACLLIASRLNRLSASLRILCFAALWSGGSSLLDLLGAPFQGWALSAALALEAPRLWPIVEVGGWPLLDAVLLGAAAAVRACVDNPRISSIALVAGAFSSVVLSVHATQSRSPGFRMLRVGVVQPNTKWETLRNVGASPSDRARVKAAVHALTDRALASGAELVVWPENGVGLPLGQLPRELDRLRATAKKNSAEILATGDEIRPGLRLPSGWLISETRVSVVHKQDHVPMLERSGTRSSSTVVDAGLGKLGILICYDVIRYQRVGGAIRDGAELLISPTDNSSFVSSTLTQHQLAFGALLAIEHGRPLVFVANRGPSTLVDPSTRRIEPLVSTGRAGFAVVDVVWARHATIATQGGRLVTTLVLVGLSLLLILRQSMMAPTPPTLPTGESTPFLIKGALTGLAWSAATYVGAEASLRLGTPARSAWDVVRHHARGVQAKRVFDPGSEAFQQSDEDACGPAALAWVAFGLGDTAFESQFRTHDGRHSLADLARAANERGLRARPFIGKIEALEVAGDTLYVLHVDGNHFVGCRPRPDGNYAVFDPARGKVVVADRDALLSRWSGHGLEVRLPKPIATGRFPTR